MIFESIVAHLLERGVAVRFRARGDSMHPTIRCGEHVRVFPLDASALACGDIVLARHPRGLTAHRVVRIERRNGGIAAVTTRGDNALVADPILTLSALLGRVEQVECNGAPAVVSAAPSRLHVLARHFARLIRRASTLSLILFPVRSTP